MLGRNRIIHSAHLRKQSEISTVDSGDYAVAVTVDYIWKRRTVAGENGGPVYTCCTAKSGRRM